MPTAQEGDRVLLLSATGKRFFVRLQSGEHLHSHEGILEHEALIGTPYGQVVRSHLGKVFYLLRPSIHDELMSLKRVTQIIYPKELGQILLMMDIHAGCRVIEAGTGSGALTMGLAYAVNPGGCVYSYEARPEILRVARRNLERVGLSHLVEFLEQDIAQGFAQTDVDALFLDVREPWEYLDHVVQALADGGFFGALVPTANQVIALLEALAPRPFIDVCVLETLLRHYKPVPARLRPEDVMVGHTGFLIFARKVNPASFRQSTVTEETSANGMAK